VWDKGENTKWELKKNPIVIERAVLDKIRVEIAEAFIKHGLGNTKICFDILKIIDRKGEQHD